MGRHTSGAKATRKARARASRRRREQVEVERSSPRARAAERYWSRVTALGLEAAGAPVASGGGGSPARTGPPGPRQRRAVQPRLKSRLSGVVPGERAVRYPVLTEKGPQMRLPPGVSQWQWQRVCRQVLATAEVCAICHRALQPDARPRSRWASSVDHRLPLAALRRLDPETQRLLALTPSNLQAAHVGCNARKRDRPQRPQGLWL